MHGPYKRHAVILWFPHTSSHPKKEIESLIDIPLSVHGCKQTQTWRLATAIETKLLETEILTVIVWKMAHFVINVDIQSINTGTYQTALVCPFLIIITGENPLRTIRTGLSADFILVIHVGGRWPLKYCNTSTSGLDLILSSESCKFDTFLRIDCFFAENGIFSNFLIISII